MSIHVRPESAEVFFKDDDLIVSKTDLKGRLTYANSVFCSISGYRESEIIGQQHSIIRHPDMPRAVFKLLWSTVLEGKEIFAYVKNRTKSNGFYWVFAHVTPSRDAANEICGFHSNRRVPKRSAIEGTIEPLYRELVGIENAFTNAKAGLQASSARLNEIIAARGQKYDDFIFAL